MGLVDISGNENSVHCQLSQLGNPLQGAMTMCLKFMQGRSQEHSHKLSRKHHRKQKPAEIPNLVQGPHDPQNMEARNIKRGPGQLPRTWEEEGAT